MAQFVGDVFGLNAVYDKQLENIANGNFASWPEGATYGYFGGGSVSTPGGTGPRSYINRIDFSTETFTDPGNFLPSAISLLGAVSSAYYGYFGGGSAPSPLGGTLNTITRFDFSSETASNPGNNLPSVREQLVATESSSYGYFGGGNTVPATLINTITRLDFSSETASNPGNNLPTSTRSLAATSSSSYGYFGGGGDFTTPTFINTISRLDFSNETLSLPGNNLPFARKELAATSSNSYGYFGGGSTAPTAEVSTINKLDLSIETISNVANLPSIRSLLTSAKNNYYGYFAGGSSQPATPNVISTTTRLNFSTETVSNTTNLPLLLQSSATVLGGQSTLRGKGFKTYGYFAGGILPGATPPLFCSIFRFDFSNETGSDLLSVLPTGRQNLTATSSNFYGYFGGGNDGIYISAIIRLDFTNETISTTSSVLSLAKDSLATTASNSYGYFAGGMPPNTGISTIDRLDFFTEVVSTKNPLGRNTNEFGGVSSSLYGYFGGGDTPSPQSDSRIDRLNFSTETISNPGNYFSPGGKQAFSATQGSSYGYFAGSNASNNRISTITRLDFSNETISDPGKFLVNPGGVERSAASSSSSYAYFGGGSTGGGGVGTQISTISRLDFSNETVSATTPLPSSRSDFAAVSNSN